MPTTQPGNGGIICPVDETEISSEVRRLPGKLIIMDESHWSIIRQGKESWNTWRKEHPQIVPELANVYLDSKDLREINFNGTNLYKAKLSSANLFNADLIGANLREADLQATDFRNADLEGANLTKTYRGGAIFNGAYLGNS